MPRVIRLRSNAVSPTVVQALKELAEAAMQGRISAVSVLYDGVDESGARLPGVIYEGDAEVLEAIAAAYDAACDGEEWAPDTERPMPPLAS